MPQQGDAYEEDLLQDYYAPEPEFGDAATEDPGVHPGDRIDYEAIAIGKYERGEPLDENEKHILRAIGIPVRERLVTVSSKQDGPTAEKPLRGLKHLGAVATLGRSSLLALAEKPVSYLWRDTVVAGTI